MRKSKINVAGDTFDLMQLSPEKLLKLFQALTLPSSPQNTALLNAVANAIAKRIKDGTITGAHLW